MGDRGEDSVDLGIPGLGPATLIGRGGFGLVYRATQLSSGGPVAVKVLQNPLDETASMRFQREASALGSLRGHPNICTVYDAGADAAGRPYLVMELAPTSLAKRVADGALPWSDAATIAVRLAGALETAHRERLLHRDIKPENVLIDGYGAPKLADFGLARLSDDTLSRDLTATVTHAAPELIDGAPASVASDVYALGSTLFVTLTGRPAFALGEGAHQASIFKRIAEEPVPDMPGTPADVAGVVRTAMAKAPADRFDSAAEMGLALQRAQQRAGVPVTPLPLPIGETLPPGTTAVDPDPTVDDRTPAKVGDLTAAVQRGDREVPPTEDDLSSEHDAPTGTRPSRRALLTAVALIAVVALLAAGIALRGGDGDGDEAGTTSSTTQTGAPPVDEVSVSGHWIAETLVLQRCDGADGGPCPDDDVAFDLSFDIDCPPISTSGGFGRSLGQEAGGGCTIAFVDLPPEPLELIDDYLSSQFDTELQPSGLVWEVGPGCEDDLVHHAINVWASPEDVEADGVVAKLQGELFLYPEPRIQEVPTCGSSYHFEFIVERGP